MNVLKAPQIVKISQIMQESMTFNCRDDAAKFASEAAGFEVTRSNLSSLMSDLEHNWEIKGGSKNGVSRQKLQALESRIQAVEKRLDELGL